MASCELFQPLFIAVSQNHHLLLVQFLEFAYSVAFGGCLRLMNFRRGRLRLLSPNRTHIGYYLESQIVEEVT